MRRAISLPRTYPFGINLVSGQYGGPEFKNTRGARPFVGGMEGPWGWDPPFFSDVSCNWSTCDHDELGRCDLAISKPHRKTSAVPLDGRLENPDA